METERRDPLGILLHSRKNRAGAEIGAVSWEVETIYGLFVYGEEEEEEQQQQWEESRQSEGKKEDMKELQRSKKWDKSLQRPLEKKLGLTG
ncbi:hypothetical protein ATANTOWER_011241 [Ataeniobius toweri]|uniref:Uncharacterized protein n=1 Tax=Ataeniobius toweri TaxID=208326 RepID=A0ABU7AEG9_9TELE|nr:hypothetical protein [Ataeniobius toweri]